MIEIYDEDFVEEIQRLVNEEDWETEWFIAEQLYAQMMGWA